MPQKHIINLQSIKGNIEEANANDVVTPTTLLPNTLYNINYSNSNFVISNQKTFKLLNVLTKGSTSYRLLCNEGKISIKYNDQLTQLVSGTPTIVNSYSILYTQEVDNVCELSDDEVVGTIYFQLCGINVPNTELTVLKDGKRTLSITGLQAYTFTQTLKDNQTIHFVFFLMNNDNQLILLGTTASDPKQPSCSNTCSAMPINTSISNPRIPVPLFDNNKNYYYQIYFSSISTSGDEINATIKIPRSGSVEGPCT